jgi:beta-glucosidase-like glycosyl hydrolase
MTQHAPLIIDIDGLSLTKADRRRLKHPLAGGIILFARNWKDRRQLSDLCTEIKDIREDLLICVDHEGGRVQRFRTDGFTHLPPMRELGLLWMKDQLAATNAATACGYVLGAELRACGVDFSFTPVLDLDYGESGVIGDRAFGRDPRVVTLLAKSLMHGLLQAGVANCGKHFPGHGFVKADSHTDIPVDKRSLKAILADDAAPYGWLNTTLTSVMPAHVIYPRVDAQARRFLQPVAQLHPAQPAGLRRRDFQRRPQHGRRPPDRRPGSQLHRGGRDRAQRRLRHGVAVQPVGGRRPAGGRTAGRHVRGAAQRPMGSHGSQRAAAAGAVAAGQGVWLG